MGKSRNLSRWGDIEVTGWQNAQSRITALEGGEIASALIGDFETGDYSQWRKSDGGPNFSQILDTYEPTAAFGGVGDGQHNMIVSADGSGNTEVGQVRIGTYANKVMLHNTANGGGTQVDPSTGDSGRRRSEITKYTEFRDYISADKRPLRDQKTTWFTASYFVPADWDTSVLTNWGIIVFQIKGNSDHVPTFTIEIVNGEWRVTTQWTDVADELSPDWQKQGRYSQADRDTGSWDELLPDYAEGIDSMNALADLNLGGWTDFAVKVTPDWRGSASGGSGRLELWKRSQGGAWTKILDILPKTVTAATGGNAMTYDRGIFLRDSENWFYSRVGMYSGANQILDASVNRLLYIDCHNYYEGSKSFAEVVAEAW